MLAEATVSTRREEGLRRFDMRRDLLPLADLIDLAFASRDERARRSLVAEMRRVGRAGPLLWLLDASAATFWPLISGFVWVSSGRLVGNVTLVREGDRRNVWTISNVAVHPDFRGRGIAHQLLRATLDEARRQGASVVLLEVERGNVPAQQLYSEFGFEVYDTLAELSLPSPRRSIWRHAPAVTLRRRLASDSEGLYRLFQVVTPVAVQKVKPLSRDDYCMGIGMRLSRWLDDALYRCQRSDWILEHDHDIVAMMQVVGQYSRAEHRLQLDVHPNYRGTVEESLLVTGLHILRSFPDREVVSTVSMSHSEAWQAFRQAGFREVRVLDQMWLDLRDGLERGGPISDGEVSDEPA